MRLPARLTGVLTGFAICLAFSARPAMASSPATFRTTADPPYCLAAGGDPTAAGQFLVGYASGRLTILDAAAPEPSIAWEASAPGAVLALLALPRLPSGRDIVAATATGEVLSFRPPSAVPTWRFASTCELSALAQSADVDGDGAADILAGGADHRVHLLGSRSGRPIWTHLFESESGSDYVSRLLVMDDCNNDGFPDVAVNLWSGEVAALDGRTGQPLWRQPISAGMTDGFALAPDLNGDGCDDLLVGGNDAILHACFSRNGSVLWSAPVTRAIRDIAVTPAKRLDSAGTSASQPVRNVAACVGTAGGEVLHYELATGAAPPRLRWTAQLGDVCRSVVFVPDVDGDGLADVAACAENGVAAIFASRSGATLSRWIASDVTCALCPLTVSGEQRLAIASLDGTVTIPAIGSGLATEAPPTAELPRQTTFAPPTAPPAGRPAQSDAQSPTAESPRVLILLYHDVLPEARNHYSTSVADFTAQMDLLVQEGYVCVSLDQIADWVEGKGAMPARAVCITFDGQYRGQCTYAVPILRAHGYFATSYVTTNWIGTANHSDWRELRELDASRILDVQNHSISHPSLTRVDSTEVVRQLTLANAAISRHLRGKQCRHHAYPSGAHNDEVQQLVRAQGFRTATTVRAAPVSRDADCMALPRFTLCAHKNMQTFRGWLTGENPRADEPVGKP